MPEPVPADLPTPWSTPGPTTVDLATLEHRQSLLHAALAAFQAGIPNPQPLGAYGLALYHRLAVVNDAHSIEAVLVHSAGGEIASGFLPIKDADIEDVRRLRLLTTDLLVTSPWPSALYVSTPQQSQSLIPCPVPVEGRGPIRLDPAGSQPPAAAAGPEPESTAAAAGPEPESPAAAAEAEPEPDAQADEPPTAEEVAAIRDDLEHIFRRRPSKVKELTREFRTYFQVPLRTAVPKAITTRERVQWLRQRIDVILAEIAAFDENVKTAEAELIAEGAVGSRGFTALDP
jgi:hypothetical protein